MDFRLSFLACVVAPFLCSLAADQPDFRVQGNNRIEVRRVSEDTLAALAKVEDKSAAQVRVAPECSHKDFAALCALGWIEELELKMGNENITSFEPLAQLPALRIFTARGVPASKEKPFDLHPLAGLTKLQKLDFYATRVRNTAALKNLERLISVSFYMSAIDSLEFLRGTPEVRKLNLYGSAHTFSGYEPLLALPKLTDLDIYINPQATDEKLAVLTKLTTLRRISMSNCHEVTSLDFLANCRNMRQIRANWCRNLVDISAVQGMDLLEELNIDKAPVTDITCITGKTHLRRLSLHGIQVKDISPVATCVNLERLNLSGMPLTDLSPLHALELDPPRYLHLSKDTVPADQLKALRERMPTVDFRWR